MVCLTRMSGCAGAAGVTICLSVGGGAAACCVQVVRREGMSRGFGFVTFKDEISVEKCLLVNHFIKGRKVELKRAVPKVSCLAWAGLLHLLPRFCIARFCRLATCASN